MEHNELIIKLIENLQKMLSLSDLDRSLMGNAFWEITDRKIELHDPTKVKLKKGIYIVENTQSEPKGKSIIEPTKLKEDKNGRINTKTH